MEAVLVLPALLRQGHHVDNVVLEGDHGRADDPDGVRDVPVGRRLPRRGLRPDAGIGQRHERAEVLWTLLPERRGGLRVVGVEGVDVVAHGGDVDGIALSLRERDVGNVEGLGVDLALHLALEQLAEASGGRNGIRRQDALGQVRPRPCVVVVLRQHLHRHGVLLKTPAGASPKPANILRPSDRFLSQPLGLPDHRTASTASSRAFSTSHLNATASIARSSSSRLLIAPSTSCSAWSDSLAATLAWREKYAMSSAAIPYWCRKAFMRVCISSGTASWVREAATPSGQGSSAQKRM